MVWGLWQLSIMLVGQILFEQYKAVLILNVWHVAAKSWNYVYALKWRKAPISFTFLTYPFHLNQGFSVNMEKYQAFQIITIIKRPQITRTICDYDPQ